MSMKGAVLAALLAVSTSAVADDRVIVEFREAPAVRRAGQKSVANYDATFARFRADVAGIAKSSRNTVTREYFRAFHGVAATLPRDVVARVSQLPYVAAVYSDLEVQAYQSTTGDSVAQVGAKNLWATRGV